MRLVFVNNAHPLTPHVSGMRLFHYANAMAQRGHRIVLLTGAPPNGTELDDHDADLSARLEAHDWSQPMVLPISPLPGRFLQALRAGRVPSLPRRAMTAWQFIVHGGVFPDWTRAANPVASQLATLFSPHLVWATFGNTSNLTLGQTLAREAKCAWVVDAKDNWIAFVPRGLRRLMAFKLRDASGLTSNAEHHLRIARKWFRQSKTEVIYSGVVDAFYAARQEPKKPGLETKILLVGGTYSKVVLGQFIAAFGQWREGLVDGNNVRLHYAGSDAERVQTAVDSAGLSDIAVVNRQLPLPDLAIEVRSAAAVCYLWAPFTFHHKLLELLILGVPVISYPGEHPESLRLASTCPTPFFPCRDVVQLAAAFDQASAFAELDAQCSPMPRWRWSDFSVGLEAFFSATLSGKDLKCAA